MAAPDEATKRRNIEIVKKKEEKKKKKNVKMSKCQIIKKPNRLTALEVVTKQPNGEYRIAHMTSRLRIMRTP